MYFDHLVAHVNERAAARHAAASRHRLHRSLRAAARGPAAPEHGRLRQLRLGVAFRLVEVGLRLATPPAAPVLRERR